jgi:hypothetical protein
MAELITFDTHRWIKKLIKADFFFVKNGELCHTHEFIKYDEYSMTEIYKECVHIYLSNKSHNLKLREEPVLIVNICDILFMKEK